MNKFYNFSENVKNAFNQKDDQGELTYIGFSQLLSDCNKGTFQSNEAKANAMKEIRYRFRLICGLSEDASPKEIRRAIIRHKDEIFEVIEDSVGDMLTSGWTDNPFFNEFVEIRNLALGDQNEFTSEDKTVLTVGEISGDHWDLDRQRLGHGESFRVKTSWVGLAIYEEFEKIMTGRGDWTRLVDAIYKAMDNYVNSLLYSAVISAGSQVLPGSDQFYKTAKLDKNAKQAFITMIEDVQAANQGSEVVIMGTKTALSRLTDLADIDWISNSMKEERHTTGRIGMFEGTRLVEIPQVFAKNDTSRKLVDTDILMIMPVADNKFVKLVWEGDAMIKEVTDEKSNNDMTYEYKYMTKLGVATIIGRYFGTWKHVA